MDLRGRTPRKENRHEEDRNSIHDDCSPLDYIVCGAEKAQSFLRDPVNDDSGETQEDEKEQERYCCWDHSAGDSTKVASCGAASQAACQAARGCQPRKRRPVRPPQATGLPHCLAVSASR
jgi:hypothetical protein